MHTLSRDFAWLRHELTTKPLVGMIGLHERIGVRSFLAFLEHRHFPPGTPLNMDYQLAMSEWGGLHLYILVIPRAKLAKADALMASLGLRRADGVPHLVSPKSGAERVHHHFPVDLPNMFTLENIKDHFIYKNDPVSKKTAAQFEEEAIEREITEYQARHRMATRS